MRLLGEIDDGATPVFETIPNRSILRNTLCVTLAISGLLLVAGIIGHNFQQNRAEEWQYLFSALVAFGTIGLCAVALVSEFLFMTADWLLADNAVLFDAFARRDRRGICASWVISLATDDDRKIRTIALTRILSSLQPGDCRVLSTSQHSDVRQAIADHQNAPHEVLLNLVTDTELSVRTLALQHILPSLSSEECTTLSVSSYSEVRRAIANHLIAPRGVLIKLAADTDQSVRREAIPKVLPSLTSQESGALSPHVSERDLSSEVVEAVLRREGNTTIYKCLELLRVNATFRLVSSARLTNFLVGLETARSIDIVSKMTQEKRSFHVGTVTEERTVTIDREETETDAYGSYIGTSTVTETRTVTDTTDRHITIAYFDPPLFEKVLDFLHAFDLSKRREVLRQMAVQNQALAKLLSYGLNGGDWRKLIEQEILRPVRAIRDRGFTPLPDEHILRQMNANG